MLLLSTEKDCRKIRTGKVEFLPETSKAAECWYVWRKVLKVTMGGSKFKRDLVFIPKKVCVDYEYLKNI